MYVDTLYKYNIYVIIIMHVTLMSNIIIECRQTEYIQLYKRTR